MIDVAEFDMEQALSFARRLRGDPATMNPPDWRVDWADAPWPLKVYDAAPGRRVRATEGRLAEITGVLVECAGVSVVRAGHDGPRARRPVASGGAMYPTEIYVAVTGDQAGVYHFDPGRHELVDLGHPDPAAGLGAALGTVPDVALLFTQRFWKNFHKYGDFAYRLGAVDLGVLLGRVVRRTGQALRVDFDDTAADALLGLDGQDEATYAVLTVGGQVPARSRITAARPPAVRERSRGVRRSADLLAMHRAARRLPSAVGGGEPVTGWPGGDRHALPAPVENGPVDLRRRTSNGRLFTGEPADACVLSAVLHNTAAALALARELCADREPPALRLCCAVSEVDGVPDGWYGYDAGCLVSLGGAGVPAPGRGVQDALHSTNLNLELAAFTVHVVGPLDFRHSCRGVRQYRVRQVFAGIAVDAVTVAAVTAGCGSHPLLGFAAGRLDAWYGLPAGHGVLAQVCVGRVRPGAGLEGSVW